MDQRWGWDVTFINVVRCKVININLRPNWNKLICKCLVNWKKYIFSAAAIASAFLAGSCNQGEWGAQEADERRQGDGCQPDSWLAGHGQNVPGARGSTQRKLGTSSDRVGGCQEGDWLSPGEPGNNFGWMFGAPYPGREYGDNLCRYWRWKWSFDDH